MPKPVMGASLIFAGSFMVTTGFEEMLSEPWNARKTFVVGISFFLGMSTAFLPSLYARTPHIMQALSTDPLAAATIVPVVLSTLLGLDATFEGAQARGSERRAQWRLWRQPDRQYAPPGTCRMSPPGDLVDPGTLECSGRIEALAFAFPLRMLRFGGGDGPTDHHAR
ncbi:MAG: hypothetical protein PHU43_10780 [Candidatus Bipolaricaulis sp.]|nr:hypothetical protein [Candidatus Bipolaricaulis sp.]